MKIVSARVIHMHKNAVAISNLNAIAAWLAPISAEI
jgi:hypothetical protein